MQESEEMFICLINIEEQYSLWPLHKSIPNGWKQVGEAASKEDCLKYISQHWTDMRPLSLRKVMQ